MSVAKILRELETQTRGMLRMRGVGFADERWAWQKIGALGYAKGQADQ